MTYSARLKQVLTNSEQKLFSSLKTPQRIQTFLEQVPVNFERSGETNLSPRQLIKKRVAHCFEGAVFAAAVLAFHGQKPLLMDFATAYDDEDHTIALFRSSGLWGAISKTNHSVLRYRDPVYRSARELAASYFHEYFMYDGRKSLRAYSQPFDLSKYAPETWVTRDDSDKALDWLMSALSSSRYTEIAPHKAIQQLRNVSSIELRALKFVEYTTSKRQR